MVATGIYLPPAQGTEAVTFLVRTPALLATDAYYQELLGTMISMLMSHVTLLISFSDYSSAIRRKQQALYPLEPVVGHLHHGTLFLGLRKLASQTRYSTSLM